MITFLGKVDKKDGEQYKEANYDFGDGVDHISRFFGKALKDFAQPDKVILLGTSGSMWDVLVESILESDAEDDQKYIENLLLHSTEEDNLKSSVEKNNVTQEQLDFFKPFVTGLLGEDCSLKIIPYGDDEHEQIEILQKMAEGIGKGDEVTLDITHGFRHLPMLGLLSAMYLQVAKKAEIKNIYYAALDRTPKDDPAARTPVMKLKGLLTIAKWINALDGFDKTKNILPFSKLFENEGVEKETADLLKRIAFFENILDVSKAKQASEAFDLKTKGTILPRIAGLFQDGLNERISWYKDSGIYQRQRSRAEFYLQQHDFVRAAAMGFETLLTFYLEDANKSLVFKLDPESYEDRDEIKENLNSQAKELNDLKNRFEGKNYLTPEREKRYM